MLSPFGGDNVRVHACLCVYICIRSAGILMCGCLLVVVCLPMPVISSHCITFHACLEWCHNIVGKFHMMQMFA